MNIENVKSKDGDAPKPVVARTPADIQRLKLEKLMKNPDKLVIIPEKPKERGAPVVPDFVRNVMGSSAGAGSGEFHVYRHLRRKEYARQHYMSEKARWEKLEDEYHDKIVENKRKSEEETAKKRAKRLKKKQNARKKGKGDSKAKSPTPSSSESEEEEEDEENQPLAETLEARTEGDSETAETGIKQSREVVKEEDSNVHSNTRNENGEGVESLKEIISENEKLESVESKSQIQSKEDSDSLAESVKSKNENMITQLNELVKSVEAEVVRAEDSNAPKSEKGNEMITSKEAERKGGLSNAPAESEETRMGNENGKEN